MKILFIPSVRHTTPHFLTGNKQLHNEVSWETLAHFALELKGQEQKHKDRKVK